jgi:hypothetical protein
MVRKQKRKRLTLGLTGAEESPTDQSATERQERSVDVGALFIANTESTKLVKPGESSFDHPPMFAQTAAMFSISFCQQGYYVAGPKISPDSLSVIATVPN